MARQEEIEIEIKVDDKDLDSLQSDLKKVDSQVDMTKKSLSTLENKDVKIDTTGASNSLNSLESDISIVDNSINEVKNNKVKIDTTGAETSLDSLNDGAKKSNTAVKLLNRVFNALTSILRNLGVELKDADEELEDLQSGLKDVDKQAKKTEDSLSDVATETKDLGKESSDSKTKVGGLSKGFGLLGGALKGLGIGVIITVITALASIIAKNQKVVDFLSTTMNALQLAVNEVTSAISNAFDRVSELTGGFDATKEVLSSLVELGLAPFRLLILNIEKGVTALQLAWEQSFLGNNDPEKIAELTKSLTEVDREILKLQQSVVDNAANISKNYKEAIDEVGSLASASVDELSKISAEAIIEQAKNLTALEKQAQIVQAINQGLVEQYDVQAERLRQIRDDESISIQERINANTDLGLVLEKQSKLMLNNAGIIIANAQARLNASNTIENQVALQEALNEKIGIEAQITGFQSEQLVNKIALQKEVIELQQSEQEGINALNFERQRFNAEQINDEVLRLEALQLIKEQERISEQKRLEEKRDTFNEGTQARIDAELELNQFLETNRQEQVTSEREIQEAKNNAEKERIENEYILEVERLKALNELQAIQDELEEARLQKRIEDAKIGSDAEMQAIADLTIFREVSNRRREQNEKRTEKAIQQAKEQTALAVASSLQSLANLVGESTATGKALGIASATIDTYVGANKALAQGGTLGVIQAVGIIANGLANVRRIATVQIPTTSVGGTSVGGGGGASVPIPPTPNFNIVGSSETNQLAQAVGDSNVIQQEQSQQPIKAFVVASDVTTQQALDRAITDTATIG